MTRLSTDLLGDGRLDPVAEVLDGLPIPALVLAPAEDGWRVALASPVFASTFGLERDPVGAALVDLMPADRTVVVEGPSVDELLGACVARGEPRSTRVRLDAPADADPRVAGLLRSRWTLRLQPLSAPAGGVLVTFVDLSGQLLASAERTETAALQDLAAGLTVTKPLDQVYADAVRGAALAAGARRSAILLSRGGEVFDVVAVEPDDDLEPQVVVDDLASPVWQACLGRRRIAWQAEDSGEAPPLPFAGRDGWQQVLATGLSLHGRWQGLLVVGEPRLGSFDADAAERLDLVATLASTAVDNARLVDQFQRLEDLLTAAVATSASLVDAPDPDLVRQRLLDGLVTGMGFAGAALWGPHPDGDGRLRLLGSAGLPDDACDHIGVLGPQSIAAKLASGALTGSLREAATAAATSSWPGYSVRLVQVPSPAESVLGVYSDRPLPELVDGVLATLAQALAAAVHQVTLHERARTVVDSLQRELRPRNVALPAAVDVGQVYRSATAGVDVGGDFYDWFITENDHIGVACGDVSGKGVEAASLTAMAVYSLRAFALRGATAQIVLRMLNSAVYDQTPPERFMTIAYVRLEPETWAYQLALAGHPAPALVDGDGARFLELVPEVPVGVEEDATYDHLESALEPGQALVLYTDGVTEARAADGRLFGPERLQATLDDLARDRLDAQHLADGVWEAVRRWTDDGTTDDCAIVVLRRAV